MAKWVSLIVKFGALSFIVFVPLQYAIQLQLLGGIWIIQTLPTVLIGLYTRWFNAWALLIGWAAGTFAGTYMVASVNFRHLLPDDRQLDRSGLHCGLRVDPQSGHRHRGNAANEYPRRETTGPDRSGRLLRLIPPPQLIELTPRDPACSQLQSERSLCRIIAAVPPITS